MWRKLFRAGPRGWLELLEAQLRIVHATLRVRSLPQGSLVTSEADRIAEVPGGDPATVDRIVMAMNRVGRYGLVNSRCLVRSIALESMLRSRKIPEVQVRFGVRRRNGAFESHAWVEWKGEVIGDDPRHVRSFVPVEDLSLHPGGGPH